MTRELTGEVEQRVYLLVKTKKRNGKERRKKKGKEEELGSEEQRDRVRCWNTESESVKWSLERLNCHTPIVPAFGAMPRAVCCSCRNEKRNLFTTEFVLHLCCVLLYCVLFTSRLSLVLLFSVVRKFKNRSKSLLSLMRCLEAYWEDLQMVENVTLRNLGLMTR